MKGSPERLSMVRRVLLILIALSAFSAPATASPIEGNPEDVARMIATYFPKITGTVSAVEGETVLLNLKGHSGLSEGLVLTVFKEGEFFYHPVTKTPLGRHEEELGQIEINALLSDQVTGKIIQAHRPIQAGDLVRISATRIPLGITGLDDLSLPWVSELSLSLKETGRFKMGTEVKAPPYLIVLETLRPDASLIRVKMKNTLTGKLLLDVEIQPNSSQESDLIMEQIQHPRPPPNKTDPDHR